MAHRNINTAGLELVKSYESFVPFVYDDLRPVKDVPYGYREWDGSKPVGTLTIGYGHTNDAAHPLKIRKGLRVTEAEALDILNVDLDECENEVSRAVKVPLSNNQFAALVSFHFNTGAIFKASFVKRLNQGEYAAVRPGLMQYVYSKGQALRGLVRRREAEAALFTRKDVARKVEPITQGVDEPKGNVVPEAPVEDQPLSQSGVLKGAGTAAAGGSAVILESASTIADKLDQADSHISAGTWLGLLIGLLIIVGAGYAVYSRTKAAGKLPSWWPAWLGG
jgi:GH24 family phage-related lysozyme (muramidase)